MPSTLTSPLDKKCISILCIGVGTGSCPTNTTFYECFLVSGIKERTVGPNSQNHFWLIITTHF